VAALTVRMTKPPMEMNAKANPKNAATRRNGDTCARGVAGTAKADASRTGAAIGSTPVVVSATGANAKISAVAMTGTDRRVTRPGRTDFRVAPPLFFADEAEIFRTRLGALFGVTLRFAAIR
jgi:hypothetical protein